MPDVARLEPVDLRKVWKNEASDFTPWLAKNLEELGEALGIDLEFIGIEAPVGRFSLDILARDVNENRTVVIENQLEPTNHDHLGKVLTYAAGHNADVMVWIVKKFLDEHRQALDWLNQRTGEETEFYGVEVRAVRIGDSPAAPVFEVVAPPNTFRKRSITSGGSAPVSSPKRSAYLDFWPRVVDRLRDDYKLTARRTSTPRHWMDFASGVPGVKRNVSFTRQDARVEPYLDTGDQSNNKRLFDLLYEQKENIESAFGEALFWERLDSKRASRIALYRPNSSVNDTDENLSSIADWIVNKYVHLVKTVIPIVSQAADEIDYDVDTDYEISEEENG